MSAKVRQKGTRFLAGGGGDWWLVVGSRGVVRALFQKCNFPLISCILRLVHQKFRFYYVSLSASVRFEAHLELILLGVLLIVNFYFTFRLPEVSMLSRTSLHAFSDDFVHFEASKKKQIVLSSFLEEEWVGTTPPAHRPNGVAVKFTHGYWMVAGSTPTYARFSIFFEAIETPDRLYQVSGPSFAGRFGAKLASRFPRTVFSWSPFFMVIVF